MGSIAGIVTAATTGVKTGLAYEQEQASGQAASLRGRFQNDVAERNAQIADMQREDALNRGATAEDRALGETDQAVSSGRAAAAAGGADVNVGSALQETTSTRLVGQVDALTIRNNAAREAWGYDVEAANQRLQGKLALIAGENEAATDRLASYGTLLSGATSLYGEGSKMSGSKTPSLTVPTAPLGGYNVQRK